MNNLPCSITWNGNDMNVILHMKSKDSARQINAALSCLDHDVITGGGHGEYNQDLANTVESTMKNKDAADKLKQYLKENPDGLSTLSIGPSYIPDMIFSGMEHVMVRATLDLDKNADMNLAIYQDNLMRTGHMKLSADAP